MTSPDQPRPTEHAEQPCSHPAIQHAGAARPWCLSCGEPQHAPSGEPSALGLAMLQTRDDAVAAYEQCHALHQERVQEVNGLRADLAQRTAELQQARAVVSAAREALRLEHDFGDYDLDDLGRAVQALDHSPAGQEMQNRL